MPTEIQNISETPGQMTGSGGRLFYKDPADLDKLAQEIFNLGLPQIYLCTVQHTGSRFFESLLKRHYRYSWRRYESGRPFYFDHCRPEFRDNFLSRVAEGAKVITTVRDWEVVRKSWIRRDVTPIEELDNQLDEWRRFVVPRASVIVSVDAPDRNERLQRLERLIGRHMPTDWKPVG